jgi:hypothetical protein
MMARKGARVFTLSAYWCLFWLLQTSPNSLSLAKFITTNMIVSRRARGLKGNEPRKLCCGGYRVESLRFPYATSV